MQKLFNYQKQLDFLKSNYMHQPSVVSIETYTKCNARCSFCPYPELERKGTKLPRKIVCRLIDEIAQFDQSKDTILNFSRVNEPFLDSRIFDFLKYAINKIRNIKFVFFSNGTALNEKKICKLSKIKNINFFNISLNDHRKDIYEKIMRLPYSLIINRLDLLHKNIESNVISFPVTISRVGNGTDVDSDFTKWVKKNYPLFRTSVSQRGNWIGLKPSSSNFSIPECSCTQYFKLHILSNGKVAFCCIDAKGKFGNGDIYDSSILGIYNSHYRVQLRKKITNRMSLKLCKDCPQFS